MFNPIEVRKGYEYEEYFTEFAEKTQGILTGVRSLAYIKLRLNSAFLALLCVFAVKKIERAVAHRFRHIPC